MKKLFYFFVALLAVACSSGPDPGEVAAQAAKEYYTQLLAGKYEHYVDGFYRPDSIPASYRRQLIDNAKMFVGQQKDERRGILDVRVVNAVADTVKRSANVMATAPAKRLLCPWCSIGACGICANFIST